VGGVAKLASPRVEVDGANLTVAGSINLAEATVDATLELSGASTAGVAGRPAVSVMLKGPIAAPKYSFNSESLAGWLALRSVEQQSKRLEAIEATRRAVTDHAPSLLSTAPAGRAAEEDDANSPAPQASPEPGAIVADTTGGILGVVQVPPLPPPIMIQPSVSAGSVPRVPSGGNRGR